MTITYHQIPLGLLPWKFAATTTTCAGCTVGAISIDSEQRKNPKSHIRTALDVKRCDYTVNVQGVAT